ncbi:MAG: serine hydrolase [Sphingobacteriales bacterium]|nr:serine hydrolase [Sphingobacteriales bacterium]
MKKINFLFASLLLFANIYSQSPTDPRLKGLDTFALKVLKDWHAAGVTIAVVEKNKVIYTGGFGYRDMDKKLPVTENTQFAIGSCSKAFTASILGMLVNDGKADLDKPVKNYLPELKFQNEYTNDHATLRDMMCHRTGLPRHDVSWYASWATRNELLERIQYMEPTAELRAKWQYNNFMFLAQGVVIEKLTGKSWEENMKEKILKPLGMDNTNLSTTDMEKSTDHSLAFVTKDSSVKSIPYRNIDAMGPAGSVNSCAKDMAKWLITWINNGKYKGKEIIPSSYRNEAMTIQMAIGGGAPAAENPDVHITGYGFGWMISSYRGHYRVEHGGGIDGFITTTGFFPSDSIGIFVSSNQGGVSSSIRNFIADRMLKLSYRNWNKYLLDANKKAADAAKSVIKNDSTGHVFNTKPTHDLKDYAGTYKSPGYGSIDITLKDGGLISKFNSIDIRLDHYHYDQFNAIILDPSLEDQGPIRFSFHTDVSGKISKLTAPFEAGVKDIEFEKETKAMDLNKSDLKKYEGEYEMEIAPGQFAKFYVKGEKLYAFIEGQPEYELVPVEKNIFDLKILKGYSVKFEENEKGEISSCSFVQPNGTFKAKKK